MRAKQISIRVFGSPREILEDDLRGCSAVVIDVLRSSSSIVTALANGAREVIPVRTPAEAGEFATRSGRGNCLLAGEREGRRIEGFDLSNSPPEFSREVVEGRTLIFASTNGAPTIIKARVASQVYVGAYNNFSALLERLLADGNPVVLLCSGKLEQFSLEDFVCAGRFVDGLQRKLGNHATLADSAEAARYLYLRFADDIAALHRSCSHGRYLAELGYGDDLVYCAQVDTHALVPTFLEGKLKVQSDNGYPLTEAAPVSA
jgi:2-phosphosulfolactate phosphatase